MCRVTPNKRTYPISDPKGAVSIVTTTEQASPASAKPAISTRFVVSVWWIPIALLFGTFLGIWFANQASDEPGEPLPIFTIVYAQEAGPDVSQVADFTMTDCLPADQDLEGPNWDAALADLAKDYPGDAFGFHGADTEGNVTVTFDLLKVQGAEMEIRQIAQRAYEAVHRHDLCA